MIGLLYYCFAQYVWPTSYAQFDLGNRFLFLLLALGLLVAATLRYADAVVAAAAFVALLLLAALFGLQITLGQALLPFLLTATAAGMLFLYRGLVQQLAGTALANYYATCLLTLKVLALAVLYLSGNYLVVREGNAKLHHLYASEQISFAPTVCILTVRYSLALHWVGPAPGRPLPAAAGPAGTGIFGLHSAALPLAATA